MTKATYSLPPKKWYALEQAIYNNDFKAADKLTKDAPIFDTSNLTPTFGKPAIYFHGNVYAMKED